MGFHPEDQVRINSKQCLHQGNGTKNVAIVWYNQGSDLWFSPWSSRPSNRSHYMLSPPLASIPAAAYAHGLDDVLRSHGESWSRQHDKVFDGEEGHRHGQNPDFGTLRRPCTVLTSSSRWLICIRQHHSPLLLALSSSSQTICDAGNCRCR